MSDPDYRIACARLEAANQWFRDEIARLRLTDAEREAIAWVCFGKDGKEYAALRGLLERLGVTEPMTKQKRA